VAAIGVVRRAKLYYLRDKVGKRARVRTKAGAVLPQTPVAEPVAPQPEPEVADTEPDELKAAHDEATDAEAGPEASSGDESVSEAESK
jgi:hypothetical protein